MQEILENIILIPLGINFITLALIWFLIIKTFNLKYLVGERYKGWISQPPLSIHSSVG